MSIRISDVRLLDQYEDARYRIGGLDRPRIMKDDARQTLAETIEG